MQTDRQTEDKG